MKKRKQILRDDPMTALAIEIAIECDEEQALAEPADA